MMEARASLLLRKRLKPPILLLEKILSQADAFGDEGIKVSEVLLCFNELTIFIRVS
jgi:hypothetical protein